MASSPPRRELLRFYTDTGGGFNAISAEVVARLQLTTRAVGEDTVIAWLRSDAGLAPPAPPSHFMDGRLVVVDPKALMGRDGFLGGRWFADSVWEFDYGAGTLHRLVDFVPSGVCGEPVPLGFQTNAAGERTMHFPSIDVMIDGEVLPMLFDSGATLTTTDASAPTFGVEPGTKAGIGFMPVEQLREAARETSVRIDVIAPGAWIDWRQ